MRKSPAGWLVFAALLALPGCGDAEVSVPEPAQGTYVGAVAQADADAVVAFVAAGDQATFYVCGGPATVQTHTHWLTGAIDGGALSLEKNGWSATGILDGDAAQGTLTRDDGVSLDWSAHRAPAGSIAGLYATDDAGCKTGVVVSQESDDSAPRMQGSWCNASGIRMQVTPILPIELTAHGIAVEVLLGEGARRLQVQPVGD